jgi:hypothetical protein
LPLCLTNLTLRHEDIWSVSRPCRFTPKERAPQYPLDRSLGEPQSQSGPLGEEKILTPIGTRTPTPSVVQPVASRYTNCAIPVLKISLVRFWNGSNHSRNLIYSKFRYEYNFDVFPVVSR